MTKINEVYKCAICSNIVEMLHEGAGQLVCCNQHMNLMGENTTDAAKEKHVPVVEKTEKGLKVTVGSVLHPMEEAHHIEWIELIADGKVYRKMLKPGEPPVAEFEVSPENWTVREYCNLHGLWKANE
ncbi:MAG: desulfoferrodoxin [Candidatus Woesearchaeota archaeon]